jgi:hypothetical protein
MKSVLSAFEQHILTVHPVTEGLLGPLNGASFGRPQTVWDEFSTGKANYETRRKAHLI